MASRTRSATGAGFPLEARAQHRQRGLGRLPAGRLPADAVDDDEQAASGIDSESDPR